MSYNYLKQCYLSNLLELILKIKKPKQYILKKLMTTCFETKNVFSFQFKGYVEQVVSYYSIYGIKIYNYYIPI